MEGFIGAFFSTLIFGVLWGTYFMKFDYMICPVHDLGVSAWSSVKCQPNPVFVWRDWQTPAPLNVALSTVSCHWNFKRWTNTYCSNVDWSFSTHHLICTLSSPCAPPILFRFSGSAIRRFLCFGVQAGFQYQGLWTQHSRPWRNDRPHGLPVRELFPPLLIHNIKVLLDFWWVYSPMSTTVAWFEPTRLLLEPFYRQSSAAWHKNSSLSCLLTSRSTLAGKVSRFKTVGYTSALDGHEKVILLVGKRVVHVYRYHLVCFRVSLILMIIAFAKQMYKVVWVLQCREWFHFGKAWLCNTSMDII